MLSNKVILVTGGSRGIGKDIVISLAKLDYNVILNYNKSEENLWRCRMLDIYHASFD